LFIWTIITIVSDVLSLVTRNSPTVCTLVIDHKSCNMLSVLNKLTLQGNCIILWRIMCFRQKSKTTTRKQRITKHNDCWTPEGANSSFGRKWLFVIFGTVFTYIFYKKIVSLKTQLKMVKLRYHIWGLSAKAILLACQKGLRAQHGLPKGAISRMLCW